MALFFYWIFNGLLSQLVDTGIDLADKTFDKHKASDLLGSSREILHPIQCLLNF
ncbi:MAG: hypothetical protein JWR68_2878 [Polaromonas sp.]|nr:hypothetical protein [Polaromonas sp.]